MRRGLTLIEVLVALALAALLLGSVFVFVDDLARARERLGQSAVRDRAVDSFIDSIDSAGSTCVLDGAGEAGVKGGATSCTIRSSQVAAWRAAAGSASPFPSVVANTFSIETEGLTIARGDESSVTLPGRVFAIRFRYHDGEEWRDSFDSKARGRLPAAIEVSVWFDPWPDGSQPSWMPAAGTEESTRDDSPGGADSARLESSSADPMDAPIPDRIRVMVIPDASPAAGGATTSGSESDGGAGGAGDEGASGGSRSSGGSSGSKPGSASSASKSSGTPKSPSSSKSSGTPKPSSSSKSSGTPKVPSTPKSPGAPSSSPSSSPSPQPPSPGGAPAVGGSP